MNSCLFTYQSPVDSEGVLKKGDFVSGRRRNGGPRMGSQGTAQYDGGEKRAQNTRAEDGTDAQTNETPAGSRVVRLCVARFSQGQ